ncbi:MAG: efflux RND transporter periplasmic adaptor subunit [Anaerolineae bacterium]|nr:efflux RND transporter periplasmic adaptor subunit [Anaerolineae bacterium]
MRFPGKSLARVVGSAALALSLLLLAAGQPVTAQDADAPDVSATGTVQALETTPLTFGARSLVSEVLVEEGQLVHKGDVLARLDVADLELAVRNAQNQLAVQQTRYDQLTGPARDVDIAAAEAAINAAQASANAAYAEQPSANDLEIARLQTEQAQNQLWQAQLQRDITLGVNPEFRNNANNSAAAQDVQINAGLAQAETGIGIAEQNYAGVADEGPDLTRLGQANASITQAQVQLDRLMDGPDATTQRMAEIALETSALAVEQMQLQLENAIIVAPFDGVVLTNNLVVGELPPQTQPAFVLADTSAYRLDLDIDETDVVYLGVGQAVDITLAALPGASFSGTITTIAVLPTVGEAVPTYEARVTFDPGAEPVRIGMSADATIAVRS